MPSHLLEWGSAADGSSSALWGIRARLLCPTQPVHNPSSVTLMPPSLGLTQSSFPLHSSPEASSPPSPLWKTTTTTANTQERLKGPHNAGDIHLLVGWQLAWLGQGQPSEVVELQQCLVEGLVDLHVLLLGTGQGLCEGKQPVSRGGVGRHGQGV